MKILMAMVGVTVLSVGCTNKSFLTPKRVELTKVEAAKNDPVKNGEGSGEVLSESERGDINALVGTWSLCRSNEPFSTSEKITQEIDAQGNMNTGIRWYKDADCTTEYSEQDSNLAIEQLVTMDSATGAELEANRRIIQSLYAGTQVKRTLEIGSLLEGGLVEIDIKTDAITDANFSGGMEYLVYKVTSDSIELSAVCEGADIDEAIDGSYCSTGGTVGDSASNRSQKLDGIVFKKQ